MIQLMKATLLVVSLSLFGPAKCGSAKTTDMQQSAHSILAQMQTAANTIFVPEGLPGIKELDSLLGDDFHAQDFTPMELFFIAETLSARTAGVPPDSLAKAYATALATLRGDWWGLPGSMRTATSARFVKLPGAANALLPVLDDNAIISYLDGEERMFTKENQWTHADLAATLLAQLTGGAYNASAPPEERRQQRTVLASAVH